MPFNFYLTLVSAGNYLLETGYEELHLIQSTFLYLLSRLELEPYSCNLLNLVLFWLLELLLGLSCGSSATITEKDKDVSSKKKQFAMFSPS